MSEFLCCETLQYTSSSLARDTMPVPVPEVSADTVGANEEDVDEAKRETETAPTEVKLGAEAAWEELTAVEPKAQMSDSAAKTKAETEAESPFTEAETEIVSKDRLTKGQLQTSHTPLPDPALLPGPVQQAEDFESRRIAAATRLAKAKEEARLAKCVWPPAGMDDPEEQAAWWVGAVTGREKPEGTSLQAWLKGGVVLCELMNTISPGSVEAQSTSEISDPAAKTFRQMENIAAYADAARRYGVPEPDMFVTVDLFEGNSIAAVVKSLHSLGRVAQQRGVTGPTLGAHLASTNVRRFSRAQRDEARAMPARWTNRGDSLLVAPKHGTAEQDDLAQLTQAPSVDRNKIAAAIARRNARPNTAPSLARGPAHSSPRPAHRGNEALLSKLSRAARGASPSARPFGLSPRFTVPGRRSQMTPVETFEDEDAEETDSPLLPRGPPRTSAPESPSAIGWLLNENQRWRDGTQEFEVTRASE